VRSAEQDAFAQLPEAGVRWRSLLATPGHVGCRLGLWLRVAVRAVLRKKKRFTRTRRFSHQLPDDVLKRRVITAATARTSTGACAPATGHPVKSHCPHHAKTGLEAQWSSAGQASFGGWQPDGMGTEACR